MKNITPDQDVLGIPLTFDFSGDKLKGIRSLTLAGELNHIEPATPKETVRLRVSGYQLHDLALSENEALPMVLNDGLADLKLDATLQGEKIQTNIIAGFQSLKMSTASNKRGGFLAGAVQSALSDINTLNLNADVAGTLENYDIALSSDLDRVLKNALEKQVRARAAQLEKDLRAAVAARVNGPLADLKKDLGGFESIGGDLSGRLSLGSSLLKDTTGTTSPKKKIPGNLKLPF